MLCGVHAPATETRDPEAAARARARLFDDAKQIVARHGGHLLEGGGDRILAVFGLPPSSEDDGLRALRAAVELQAAAGDADDDVGIGIGVETSPVLNAPARSGTAASWKATFS